MALRACRVEQLQPLCQSSLGILQHWDHKQELREPSQAFINQRNKCLCGFMQSKCVCDTWALTVGVLSPLHSFLLEEMQTVSITSRAGVQNKHETSVLSFPCAFSFPASQAPVAVAGGLGKQGGERRDWQAGGELHLQIILTR